GGPMMGVFVPQSMKAPDVVDVIIYIHGNKVVQDGKHHRVWHTDWAIDKIWSHFTFPVREQLNKSGKQYVLVAPTLGAGDQAGQMGQYPEIVLDQAMVGLEWYGPIEYDQDQRRPKVGQIILAGHSGAGPVMLAMANSLMKGKYKGNLKEIWGFDTMYGQNEC